MKSKITFVCSECGYETAKWYGKCPGCQTWNSFREVSENSGTIVTKNIRQTAQKTKPIRLTEIDTSHEIRISTGIGEYDRVLGGGAVAGSFVLVGGEPGIGKSTLLLQSCAELCKNNVVLYVTGEESLRQIKLRAKRLGIQSDNLYIHAQTHLDDIFTAASELKPGILIIDSIQTVYKGDIQSAPGSVTQVRECAMSLMQYAKGENVTVFIVGHVNKEGSLAGPKILEHMVDCVLYFEGERHMSYRIIRAAKNRYGSTDEIGVFEICDTGLVEVRNPSEALLSGRPKGAPGSCIACAMEGSRPILAEIQALVASSGYGTPRRMSAGFDYNRAILLMAILEKRAGIFLGNSDAYINVIGGLRIDEPACDLPTILALASGAKDKGIKEGLVSFGEVGLTGEVRSVTAAAQRLSEIRRLGFSHCILPKRCAQDIKVPDGLTILPVSNIREAISIGLN